jgi:2-polyprenyl-3-methyl-5-hydroxy-6-metoxy-1,4-benzoquinol methylase
VADPTERPLTSAEAAAYWEARHRRAGELASGGHIGIGHAGNELFYARRLGALLEIIGDHASMTHPLFVLDAGCGKGHFARGLARCGHRVDAIDAAAAAIEYCRTVPGSPVPGSPVPGKQLHWAVSPLSAWSTPWLYDVVYAIDVLFHVLDDGEWAASVTNLASLVRYGGALVITDEDAPRRRPRGSYIVHRTRGEYEAQLERRGLEHRGFRPYAFRDNQVGFHIFTRTS